jgi:uncharacterized repeat protein (TIGR03803 family)
VFKVDTTGNETVLYSFPGGTDGANPYAGVIQDAAGNLYGTAYAGGYPRCAINPITGHYFPCGLVFKLDSNGQETVLHSFGNGTWQEDGRFPAAALIADPQGNLYGTTTEGGLGSLRSCLYGCGTVFEIYAGGSGRVLYAFPTDKQSGVTPDAALVRDANGNLYGTASAGGVNNAGTVFKLTP